MAIYKEDIADINLETGNIHRSFLRHSIGTQDQHADHFGIRVMRDGEPVDLTGISVQGVFMPPQGSPIAITGDTYTMVEGNVAKVILPQACYNYEGSFTLAIKLIDITDSITGTIRIIDGVVDNTHASGTVAPTGSVPTYQEILAVYADMVTALVTVDELDDEVSDLKSAFEAVEKTIGQKKTSSDYTWTLKKNITATGEESTANGFALTGYISIGAGCCVVNTAGDTGYNDKNTSFLVNQYNGSTWLSRTQIKDGQAIKLADNCTRIRIGYGYPSAESVTITQEMVDTYFSMSILQECETKDNAEKTKSVIERTTSSNNDVINAANQMVNYNYDTAADAPANPSGYSDKIGVKRNLNTIVLNGTINMNNDIKIRLNSSVSRDYKASNVEAWTGAITLKTGHKYEVRSVKTGGTITDSNNNPVDYVTVSVYKAGQSKTEGYAKINGNEYQRVFIAAEGATYHIAAYCTKYYTYTDAKANITLWDLTENGTKKYSDIVVMNDHIGALHNLINYGYDTPVFLKADPSGYSAKIGVKRDRDIVILDGTNDLATSPADIKIKVNGTIERATSADVVKGWSGIELETGKTYRASARLIGGSVTDSNDDPVNFVTLSVYRSGENSSPFSPKQYDNVYERTFTAESGVNYNFVLYIQNGRTFTNAKILVTLEKLSEDKRYIQTEADRVSDLVRNVQTGDTITFIACSDIHYKLDEPIVKGALEDLRDGIKAIARQTSIDFYACLGDEIWRRTTDRDFEKGKTEMIGATKILNDAFGNNNQIRLIGNHDPNAEDKVTKYFTAYQLYSFIGKYSDSMIGLDGIDYSPSAQSPQYNYMDVGYVDFEEKKVRLIAVNTSAYSKNTKPEYGDQTYKITDKQAYALCQMMDLSEKEDASDWQIVIISHLSLDAAYNSETDPDKYKDISKYSNILNAYQNGTTETITGYSYDFGNGHNAAKLSLCIHGHSHKFDMDNMHYVTYEGDIWTIEKKLSIVRMCVPNGLPGTDGAYIGDYKVDSESIGGVTYTKTTDTAESTSFQVITINPVDKIVYAHHYGAGIDFIIHYDQTSESSLTTTLTNPTWASRNTDIATVTGDGTTGTVTDVASGNVMIYAKDAAGTCIEGWNYLSGT